jgi:DNA-binding transcriptional MerR regulator
LSANRYTAADVKKIIGMDRNTLFYCVKTLALIQPAQHKPKAILYDLQNLLDLALIQELLSLGITQATIKNILNQPITQDERIIQIIHNTGNEGMTIWENYRDNREIYEDRGCVLIIAKIRKGGHFFTMMPVDGALDMLKVFWLGVGPEPNKAYPDGYRISKHGTFPRSFGHVVAVDILGLVNEAESLASEAGNLRATPAMDSPTIRATMTRRS